MFSFDFHFTSINKSFRARQHEVSKKMNTKFKRPSDELRKWHVAGVKTARDDSTATVPLTGIVGNVITFNIDKKTVAFLVYSRNARHLPFNNIECISSESKFDPDAQKFTFI